MNHVQDLIEHSQPDPTVHGNAMRWTPPAPTDQPPAAPIPAPAATGHSYLETSNTGTPPIAVVIAADITAAAAAFTRLAATLILALKPSLLAAARLAAHYRDLLNSRPRSHRTHRRIVRTPRPPRPRTAPAPPSALNAVYTRRYRNRQGR